MAENLRLVHFKPEANPLIGVISLYRPLRGGRCQKKLHFGLWPASGSGFNDRADGRTHLSWGHDPRGAQGVLFVSAGAELLALYNHHPPLREGQMKYYTVKVPLRVQNCDEGVKGVEANWLDHMTQHFNSGASLVDGYFHLGNGSDLLPKSVESVFIFQEACEVEPNAATPAYDAIVVEQWTVINGLQVKADYVPLLQSLATYGWRLTCVLPTPVIKTNSDGSLSTKQIVFLQRPVLGRKKRESKKLIFKPRGKSNKNCVKDTAKNKKKKKKKAKADSEAEDPKATDRREKAEREEEKSKDETPNAADRETSRGRRPGSEEDGTIEISIEKKDGGAETEDKGAGSGAAEEAGTKGSGDPSGAEEVQGAAAETPSEAKEDGDGGGVAEAAMENGVGTDQEEEEEGEEVVSHRGAEGPPGEEVIAKEIPPPAASRAAPTAQSQEEEE
ncbi:raftlin [Pungitius pungitius]|uniref:raftlin n=1 Tax=Pungitius pungitius TaxID=134920 RepID=UPI002E0D38DB